jgi:hypothetical protein
MAVAVFSFPAEIRQIRRGGLLCPPDYSSSYQNNYGDHHSYLRGGLRWATGSVLLLGVMSLARIGVQPGFYRLKNVLPAASQGADRLATARA